MQQVGATIKTIQQISPDVYDNEIQAIELPNDLTVNLQNKGTLGAIFSEIKKVVYLKSRLAMHLSYRPMR
jgi:hypothetical protein